MTHPVPWLRSGVGETPADGGCILQVVDWINRGEWTDDPPCVHPVFRKIAIRLNDSLDDDGRQRLLDLAPRLMGTNTGGKEMPVRLAVFCARRVLPVYEESVPGDARPREAVEAAETWLLNPSAANAANAAYAAAAAANAAYAASASAYAANAAYAASASAYAANAAYAAYAAAYAAYAAANAASAGASYVLLVDLLDEYDRITGRTQPETPDYTDVCHAMTGATP